MERPAAASPGHRRGLRHSEPPTGIDPVTSVLPRLRSTTELGGQRGNTLPAPCLEDEIGSKAKSGPEVEWSQGETGPEREPGKTKRSPLPVGSRGSVGSGAGTRS